MTIRLNESAFSGLGKVTGKRRWKARLVGVGAGSSAVYTEEALVGSFAAAFPVGTRVNINHQTYEENPERNLEQLAGVICTAPEFENDGMYAEVEFSEKWAPFIEEFHEVIGLSISGVCTVAAEGTDRGSPSFDYDHNELPVVEKFVYSPLNTVDVVTAPGANGRFIEALESFRGNMTIDYNQPKGEDVQVKPEDITAISTAVSEALKNVLDKRDKEKADAKKAEDQAKLDADKKKADEEEKKKKEKEKKAKESIAAAVEAIADADLPSAFRKRVAEGFARGEDVKELIKEQVELIESARSEQGVRPRAADGGSDYDAAFKELKW